MPRIEVDINTLFYSKKCEYCLQFILALKKRDLLKEFPKKICIDDPQYRRMLPPFLKEVPTILRTDIDEPIAGDRAFNWLKFKDRQIQEAKNKQVKQDTGGAEIGAFSADGAFGSDFGAIQGEGVSGDNSSAYQGLGDSRILKKDGRSQVPESMYGGLLSPEMMSQANSSNGGNGDFDKKLQAMENSRSLDMPQGGRGGPTPNFQSSGF